MTPLSPQGLTQFVDTVRKPVRNVTIMLQTNYKYYIFVTNTKKWLCKGCTAPLYIEKAKQKALAF
ncbi:hypothetical protein COF85_21955 [Bacillus toyonensis]|nr:hypothetical protein COF85_21955 [Bacillus toyonensis]